MRKVYVLLLVVFGCFSGALAQIGDAQSGINETYAILSVNGGANAYYDLYATTVNPDFQGANLGTFTINNGGQTLVLKGGQNKVYKCSGGDITANNIYYRVYKTGATPGSFSNITIPFLSGNPNGCGGADQVWEEAAQSVNLLQNLAPGNYTIDVYSTASNGNPGPGVWTADNSGAYYKASFTVTADPANPVSVTSSGGTAFANYATLGAAFAAVNAGTHTGSIAIIIGGNTTEAAAGAAINASGSGAASYTAITVTPFGAVTVSGAATAGSPLINFNGADNITINGLNSDGNALTIANTTVSATSGTSTIRFIGGATNNTITNCSLQGSGNMSVATNGAVIFFSTDGVTTSGNDNNTISNNNIGPAGANLPTKAILGNGSTTTTAIGNSGIVINNNNIFDYFGTTVTSSGIAVNGGCNGWSITNNRFYQTAARTWTTGATHKAIDIADATATSGAQGFTITGNIIGYASSTQTGTYTLTGSTGKFIGIALNGITAGTVNNINNNTIAAVSLTGVTSNGTGTSSPFIGILAQNGIINTSNNTIGSQSATGSLVYSTTTTTATDVYGIYNFSSDAWTATGNNIGGLSVTNAAASGTIIVYGMRANTGTTLVFTGTSNIIGGTVANSIQLNATGTSSQLIGIASTSAIAALSSNTIRNLTSNIGTGTTSSASVIGITTGTSTTPTHTITQNTIYNLTNTNTTASTTVTGIQFTGASGNIVARNNIYALTNASSSTTAEVNGIRIAGGTTTYRNNMITLGAGINNAIIVSGINEPLGTDNIFHNSVYIGGSPSAGSANSFAFNSTQTVNTRSFRDNIFVNARSNSGATGKNYAVRVGGSGTNPTGLTINNNVYYINGTGTVFGLYNALDVADLAAWKAAIGQDAASFQSDPQYLNPTAATPDLHINPAITTVAEGNGFDVGVTDDFDGQTRLGLTPVDIGADAGNFTGIDLAPPSISYTPLTFTCATSDRNLNGVTITDASGVPTSGTLVPRIYYKKGAGGTWFSKPGTLTTGSGTNGTWNFTIAAADMGGLVPTDQVFYYVIAQDISGTPNISSNAAGAVATDVNTVTTHPASPNSYTINNTLSGTYTVGVGGNYTTLTAAVNAYNTSCLGGPVVFSLTDASYSTSETFPITVLANPDASATNTLTIRPAATITPVITGSNTNAIIRLTGADYITINGSNNGGTSKDLTIENTNTGTSAFVVWVGSTATDGATNNTIRNIIAKGNGGATTFGGIFAGSAATAGGVAETANTNLTIQNNTAIKAQYGIAVAGNAGGQSGTNVSGNTIGSGTAADFIGFRGLFLSNINGGTVNKNSIINIVTTSTNPTGIFIAGNVQNSVFDGNKVDSIRYTGTSGYGAKGIDINTNLANSNLTFSNNMVSRISGDGWSNLASDAIVGIRIGATGGTNTTTGGINLYHNSVSLSGSFSGNTSGTQSAALFISSTATALDIRNNIFSATLDNTATTSDKTWAINTAGANTAFTNIDYNDYYVSGAPGVLGFLTADQATLANVQTAFGGNAASINSQPIFAASGDLHLQAVGGNAPLNNSATPLAAVTIDFDNETRSATTPDIGADEVVIAACTGATGGTITTPTISYCVSGAPVFTGTGYSTGIGTSYQWLSSSDGVTWTPVAAATNPASYTVSPAITTTTYYRLAVNCNNVSFDSSNVITITINALPTIAVNPPAPAYCSGQSVVLTASGADTYTWSPAGGLSAVSGTSVTANPTATTTYTVTGTVTATGCSNTATVTVTVNPLPTITVTPSTTTVCAGDIQQLTANAAAITSYTSGTGASTTTGNTTTSALGPNPLQIYYGGAKQQMLFTAAELTSLGLTASAPITAIKLNLATADNTLGLQNLVVKMKNTATATMTTWESGMTTVRPAATYTPAVGLNTIALGTPFNWNGTDNLVIEINYSNNNGGTGGTTFNTAKYSTTAFQSTIFYRVDNNTAATIDAFTGTPSFSYNSRNDVTFDVATPLSNVTWAPQTGLYTDAGATTAYTGGQTTAVYVKTGATTTYTATATNSFNCPATASSTITVTGVSGSTTLAGVVAAGGATAEANAYTVNGTTHYLTACKVIATVTPSGASPVTGSINASVRVDTGATQMGTATLYAARFFDILPATNPATATGTIKLYFTQAEFDNYNSKASDSGFLPLPDNGLNTIDSLRIRIFHGAPAGGYFPGNYSGGMDELTPADPGVSVVWNAAGNNGTGWWEISFPTNGFSGYFITSKPKAPLPVKVEYFRGSKQGSSHVLDWKVVPVNTNNGTLTLERSSDSRGFSNIYSITVSANRMLLPFSYTDAHPIAGINYYRLKMVDDNGVVTYSSIVALLNKEKGFEVLNITPNPVTEGRFKLNITTTTQQPIEVVIADIQGRVVSRKTVSLAAGFNAVEMNVSNLANGTYQLFGFSGGEKTRTITFVKE